jgi:GTP pyrophosphokinase
MDQKINENKLIENAPVDFKDKVKKSIDFAKKEFKDKKRPEGDKYIDHVVDTALKLQQEGFDTATVISSLLHHIDPTKNNLEYIEKNISKDVRDILEVYSEIDKVVKNTDASYDIATRYILNSVHDLRPVIIQIFNAQSNSHILQSIESNENRKELVKRNLNIHSTLAEYLGFDDIKTDITEEAFRITQREDYEYIEKLYKKENINREKLEQYKTYITDLLKDLDEDFKIEGRIKSKYSTFNKLKKYIDEGNTNPISIIYDLLGFRIKVKNEKNCFKILDKLWEKGDIVLEEFDDYISHPKPNGYKAMQGPIIFSEIGDMMVEVQILTEKMYQYNTYGPASHIAYKESKSRFAKPSNKYGWIKEVHNAIKNNIENSQQKFSIPIEVQIFPDEIYALTPKGRIIDLEKGDTVTDFAYRIHTDIGNSMIGAKVNNKSTSFDHTLKTGDIVEIVTQKGKIHPKPNLLRCANSENTKVKIERAMK